MNLQYWYNKKQTVVGKKQDNTRYSGSWQRDVASNPRQRNVASKSAPEGGNVLSVWFRVLNFQITLKPPPTLVFGGGGDSLANRSEGASYPIMLRSPRKNTAVGTLCPLSRLLQRSVASDSSPKALCALGEPLNSERSDLQLITLNS